MNNPPWLDILEAHSQVHEAWWFAFGLKEKGIMSTPPAEPSQPTPNGQWQPIETAPKDAEALFWIRPKTAEETYHDSYGEPLLMSGEGCARICKFKCWYGLEIATHWMPLPAAPATPGEP